MSEKRFDIAYGGNVITDEDGRDLDLTVKWCVEELIDKLNEQQATINELNEENDELKQQLKTKVIVNKQYEELQRLKKENNHLKDDFQYYMNKSATLETELLRLRKENEQLRKELGDCEKFRYTVFKRIGELNDE